MSVVISSIKIMISINNNKVILSIIITITPIEVIITIASNNNLLCYYTLAPYCFVNKKENNLLDKDSKNISITSLSSLILPNISNPSNCHSILILPNLIKIIIYKKWKLMTLKTLLRLKPPSI